MEQPEVEMGAFSALMSATDGGGFHVHLTPSVDHIYASESFNLSVQVMGAKADLPAELDLTVDAFMPLDGHGWLDDAPMVMSGEAAGEFMVMNVKLSHGNEVWELYFDVETNGATERATFEVIPDGAASEHHEEEGGHDEHDEHEH